MSFNVLLHFLKIIDSSKELWFISVTSMTVTILKNKQNFIKYYNSFYIFSTHFLFCDIIIQPLGTSLFISGRKKGKSHPLLLDVVLSFKIPWKMKKITRFSDYTLRERCFIEKLQQLSQFSAVKL